MTVSESREQLAVCAPGFSGIRLTEDEDEIGTEYCADPSFQS